ncbi:hypothetical protein [Aureliella helgolandensis]|uniref:Uncharacterized protein n=1 Tax=Aureliella helgolandensis TaxID=2527968 RepID=A0A518GA52_9BACT|nr:hypothetical protein [Aureliella helgolandensis]QDV25471.1 hypothetical protein Q31a_37970 [Aureliella helgolandensis]
MVIARSCLILVCLLLQAGTCCGQSESPGLVFNGFGKASHGRLMPGGWLVLNANVANRGEEAATARVVVTIPEAVNVQSSRTVTLSPRSKESLEVYVQIPASLKDVSVTEVQVSLYQVENGEARLLDNQGVPMQTSLRLPVQPSSSWLFLDIEAEPPTLLRWQWPLQKGYYNYEVIVASRIRAGFSRNASSFEHTPLPLRPMDWSGVEAMVISHTDFFEDAVAVDTLSKFVNGGGTAWILLDRIPCDLIQPMLASGQYCEELDEVELSSFSISASSIGQAVSAAEATLELDSPAKFKRVVQVGGEVSHAVDGWPAVTWFPVGQGKLVLTTLASEAWLEPGSESTEAGMQTQYKMRAWSAPFGRKIYDTPLPLPLSQEVNYPLELIGNPILPKGTVVLVLVAFVGLIVLLGASLLQMGKATRLGIYAPLLAIAVSSALWASSAWVRRDIPETVSRLQVVQIAADGNSALVREQAAVHLSSESAMSLDGHSEGFAQASASIQSGIKRFDVGGLTEWHLENPAWPPGAWRYTSQQVVETERLLATARLTKSGLQIDLPDQLESLADPLVSFVPNQPMLGQLSDQQVLADGSQMAEADRWVSSALIDAEQLRHSEVFQEMFSGTQQQLPPRRTLLGWTETWEGSEWTNPNLTRKGAALVQVPIRLVRPEVGQEFLLPAGMLQLRKDPTEISQISSFNDYNGKWGKDVSLSVYSHLQFLLPPETLPLQASSMDLELAIKAPHRVVRVLSRGAAFSAEPDEPLAEMFEIVSLDSPSVPWRASITDPRVLEDAQDGVIDLYLEVGERTDVEEGEDLGSVVTWNIDAFRASLIGKRMSEEAVPLKPRQGIARKL